MTRHSKASHVERTADLLERLRVWIEPREDVRAVMIVGSVARGDARPDSDVDVVLLTTHPMRYLESVDWVSDFGAALHVELEDYGNVTSVRAAYGDGLEVEFAVAAADWASAPFDSGTEGVARNGVVVLLDRDGHATALASAFGPSNPRLQRTALRAAAEPQGRQTAREGVTMTEKLRHVRHGVGAVRPYVHGHLGLWDLVKDAFDVVELERHQVGAKAFHIEAQIADSVIVLETGDPPHPEGTRGSIYVYVPDVDGAYRRALERGAVSIAAPEDKPYQERQGGVRDSFGNVWWISTYRG